MPPKNTKQKWLITGGCGFIGGGLIRRLYQNPLISLRVIDNLHIGQKADLAMASNYREIFQDDDFSEWDQFTQLFVGDIINKHQVMKAMTGADVVVHLAANTGVQPSLLDPVYDCQNNVLGTLTLLEAAKTLGVKKFIFASSGAPLGAQSPPIHEELAAKPMSPYGASKLSGEGYCSAYFHSFGLDTVALRFGNVFGPGSKNKSSVVARFIKQIIDGDDLVIYGNGEQTRDYIYIDDLVEAILAVAKSTNTGGETFQIATEKETSIHELIQILKMVSISFNVAFPKVNYQPALSGDTERNYSQTTKAWQKLGWRSQVTLTDGLKQTVKYFIEGEA